MRKLSPPTCAGYSELNGHDYTPNRIINQTKQLLTLLHRVDPDYSAGTKFEIFRPPSVAAKRYEKVVKKSAQPRYKIL